MLNDPFKIDRFWKIPAWIGGGVLALVLGLVVGFQLYAPRVVNQFNAVLSNTANNTLIYDANDNLIAAVEGLEDRHAVPISRIHPYLQKAVVAVEDRRFFSHRGMDPVRLLGALWADLRSLSIEQGGSTITQQLVKLTLLSSERTLTRKTREIFMAIALEQAFPKLKLLEFYLNRVYLGNGVYGVEKASQAYFHKSAAELNLNEAAFLAALIKKPEGYLVPPESVKQETGPLIRLELLTPLVQRTRFVIRNLAELGWISAAEVEAALDEPLVVHRPAPGLVNAPYFVQQVLKELKDNLGVQRVSGRGYRVYTTLELHMQEVAERLVTSVRERSGEGRQTSLIALDPYSGAVRALVGGVDFNESQFNRATQALRQPGSAIKPILYAAALENDFHTNSVFVDQPVRYTWDELGNYLRLYENDFEIDQALGLGDLNPDAMYEPRNYDDRYGLLRFSGQDGLYDDRRMTLARALEVSSNVIAVQLLDKLGMEPMVRLARRWNLPIRKENGLCVALGCSEVTLADLTSAYASFANGGLRVRPVFVRQVRNSDGDVLYEHFPEPPVEVITPWTSFQMRNLLSGVLERGTGRGARLDRPSGGKTGTNDGPRDAWFIGFTPNLVAGAWLGNDDNSIIPNEAGGRTTASLWRDFMRESLPPYGGETFPEPPEEYVGVKICNTDGLLDYTDCPDRSVHYFREREFNQELFAQRIPGALSTPFGRVRARPGEVTSAPANPAAPSLFSRRLQEAFRPSSLSAPSLSAPSLSE
jgi:penicillin-binding protein 1A